MEELAHLNNDYELAEYLQNTLISHATNDAGGGTAEDYIRLRKYFLDNPITKDLLPKWIRVNRDSAQFWQFIKHKFSTYAERRDYIWP